MTDPRNGWKTLGTRPIYKNAWIDVREDRVLRPNGSPGIYGVVEVAPGAAVVALDEHDHIHLVGQWRYTLGRYSWELPAGGCDGGETPLDAAHRELREEAGLIARDWQPLGFVDDAISVTRTTIHLFLATGLQTTAAMPDETEELAHRIVPFGEAVRMVMDGEITDSPSVAAILKAARTLAGKSNREAA